VNDFRIALVKKPKLLAKQKTLLRLSTIYLVIILWHWKPFLFILRKYADKDLKNHYIISKKTSITNGKNTYKKQVCNKQKVKQLPNSKVKGA